MGARWLIVALVCVGCSDTESVRPLTWAEQCQRDGGEVVTFGRRPRMGISVSGKPSMIIGRTTAELCLSSDGRVLDYRE